MNQLNSSQWIVWNAYGQSTVTNLVDSFSCVLWSAHTRPYKNDKIEEIWKGPKSFYTQCIPNMLQIKSMSKKLSFSRRIVSLSTISAKICISYAWQICTAQCDWITQSCDCMPVAMTFNIPIMRFDNWLPFESKNAKLKTKLLTNTCQTFKSTILLPLSTPQRSFSRANVSSAN